jgi:tetratricopeptide (TPR) repeat protein
VSARSLIYSGDVAAFLVRWVVVLAALSCGGSAAAQVLGPNAPPGAGVAEEPPAYREVIDKATSEYDAGRFSEARAQFEVAHNLFPNARSLRGMGMAEFELRNYPASIYFLEQALAAPVKPLTDELRKDTEMLLLRARAFVGKVTFDLQPPDASLALNGTALQLGPDRALTLIAGDYALKVSAPGYDDVQRALHVPAGQESAVRVELAKHVEVLQPPPPLAAAPPPQSTPFFERPWVWAVIGAAVAGAVLGVGFALSSETRTQRPSAEDF